MDAPETQPSGSDGRPVHPAVLIVGGPLLSITAYGIVLKIGGHSADSDHLGLLGLLASAVMPFVGALLLRERLAVRLWVALMLGIAGGLVFFCADLPVWLLAGAPGFSPG